MAIPINSLIDVLCCSKTEFISQKKGSTVEKKPLRLVLPPLETLSMPTRTELQKSIKGILNCCKLQVIF